MVRQKQKHRAWFVCMDEHKSVQKLKQKKLKCNIIYINKILHYTVIAVCQHNNILQKNVLQLF